MPTYTAFGLCINSDIELPPLLSSDNDSADIRIVIGQVDKKGLAAPVKVKPYSQIAPNELWLHIPDIAWFYVSNGNTIVVEPEAGADMQSVKLYLLGSCMGAIIYQRNLLVIHGNAIRFGDECVIFAGNSGNGKSTLAAAFHQRGYEILADDLSVIDGQLRVQPSYPQIKLWHDSAKKLEIDTEGLKRIRLQVDKYAYPIKEAFCNKPLPVKALYILNTHNQADFVFTEITGMKKFRPLKNHSYRAAYLDGLGLGAEHLKLCSQLANNIDITRITRPSSGFKLDELVALLEEDINKSKVKVA